MIGQSTDIPVSDPTPDSGAPPRRAEVPVPQGLRSMALSP